MQGSNFLQVAERTDDSLSSDPRLHTSLPSAITSTVTPRPTPIPMGPVRPRDPESRFQSLARLGRLQCYIMALCVASTSLCALLLAFGVTTGSGNLLYALVVRGRTEVQADCAEWLRMSNCTAATRDGTPLHEQLQAPSLVVGSNLLALFLLALIFILALCQLFPPPWTRTWTVAVCVSYGASLTAELVLALVVSAMAWLRLWLVYVITPVTITCAILYGMNHTAAPSVKIFRSTTEFFYSCVTSSLVLFPIGQMIVFSFLGDFENTLGNVALLVVITRLGITAAMFIGRLTLSLLPMISLEFSLAYLMALQILVQTNLRSYIVSQDDMLTVAISNVLMTVLEVLACCPTLVLSRFRIRRARRAGDHDAITTIERMVLMELMVMVTGEAVAVWVAGLHSLVLDPRVFGPHVPYQPLRLGPTLAKVGMQLGFEIIADILCTCLVLRVVALPSMAHRINRRQWLLIASMALTGALACLTINSRLRTVCLYCEPIAGSTPCPSTCTVPDGWGGR